MSPFLKGVIQSSSPYLPEVQVRGEGEESGQFLIPGLRQVS